MFERKYKDEVFARKCIRFRYRDAGHKHGNFPGNGDSTFIDATFYENTHTHITEYYKFNPTNLRMQFMNKTLFIEMMQKRHEREKAFRFLVCFIPTLTVHHYQHEQINTGRGMQRRRSYQ